MPKKKHKGILTKILILLVLISFLLTTVLPLFAAIDLSGKKSLSIGDKQKLLDNINKQKSNLSEKLKQARIKEAKASRKLGSINRKLSNARRQVRIHNNYLSSNQDAWQKTKKRLDELKSQKSILESKAQESVVEIYKKSQLKFLDSLVHSESATDYMDYLYYQKKVIEFDRNLLTVLKTQSKDIEKYSVILEEESKRIADVQRKLKTIEKDISYQQNEQRVILSKLKKETSMYESSERQLERESIKLIYKIAELSSNKKDNPDSTGKFVYPVKARITSPFGPRRHPIFGVRSMHSGIDLAAPYGTPVKASEGGLVIYSGWYGGYGKVVIVDHSQGYSTLYAHLSTVKAKVGDRIKQNQTLGYEGSTGYATGPHLHFEVRSKGKPKNPVLFLSES